jgi:hypothetical protein
MNKLLMHAWPSSQYLTQPVRAYQDHFRSLNIPSDDELEGRYKATFIGPAFLRYIAPKLLPLGGLKGWYGKAFSQETRAINLLDQKGRLIERVPMERAITQSKFDLRNALVLTYGPEAPLPLRALRDEFRWLDQKTLLGITIVDLPILRRITLPFLLRREE